MKSPQTLPAELTNKNSCLISWIRLSKHYELVGIVAETTYVAESVVQQINKDSINTVV